MPTRTAERKAQKDQAKAKTMPGFTKKSIREQTDRPSPADSLLFSIHDSYLFFYASCRILPDLCLWPASGAALPAAGNEVHTDWCLEREDGGEVRTPHIRRRIQEIRERSERRVTRTSSV